MSDLKRPVLNDGDKEILERYDEHREIDNTSELADYIRAFTRMIIATSQEDSYHMGDMQRMVGVANDLERGEYSKETVHEWFDELDIRHGVERPTQADK